MGVSFVAGDSGSVVVTGEEKSITVSEKATSFIMAEKEMPATDLAEPVAGAGSHVNGLESVTNIHYNNDIIKTDFKQGQNSGKETANSANNGTKAVGNPYIRLSDIETQEINWLWYPYIPYGKVTIFQGDGGEGKTFVSLAIATAMSIGGSLPEQDGHFKPSNVLFQTAEDGYADTIKPRLLQLGADCNRIMFINDEASPLSLTDGRLEEGIVDNNAQLLIIDPISAYIGAGVDMHRANEVRPVMQSISKVAERTGCAIIIIAHINKAMSAKSQYRGLGSIDIRNAVRSVLSFGKIQDDNNPKIQRAKYSGQHGSQITTLHDNYHHGNQLPNQNPNLYAFAQDKANLAPKTTAIAYELSVETGFRWIGAYDIDVDGLLGYGNKQMGRPNDKIHDAMEFLEMELGNNTLPATEIFEKAKNRGFSESTINRAKKGAGIKSFQDGDKWYWAIKK